MGLIVRQVKLEELKSDATGKLHVNSKVCDLKEIDCGNDIFVNTKGVGMMGISSLICVEVSNPKQMIYIMPDSVGNAIILKKNGMFQLESTPPSKYLIDNWIVSRGDSVMFSNNDKVDIYKKFPIYESDSEHVVALKTMINGHRFKVSGDRVKETEKLLEKLANSNRANVRLTIDNVVKLANDLGITTTLEFKGAGQVIKTDINTPSHVLNKFK